jgi:hypothetical protein
MTTSQIPRSRSKGVTICKNHSRVRTRATASIAFAASPPVSATSGTSQIRYCGENTLPNATKLATAAAAA